MKRKPLWMNAVPPHQSRPRLPDAVMRRLSAPWWEKLLSKRRAEQANPPPPHPREDHRHDH
jgi:hypothetical protein